MVILFNEFLVKIFNTFTHKNIYSIQAAIIKDVTLSDEEPKAFLLDKHIEYIASYDTNKEEYVSNFSITVIASLNQIMLSYTFLQL